MWCVKWPIAFVVEWRGWKHAFKRYMWGFIKGAHKCKPSWRHGSAYLGIVRVIW